MTNDRVKKTTKTNEATLNETTTTNETTLNDTINEIAACDVVACEKNTRDDDEFEMKKQQILQTNRNDKNRSKSQTMSLSSFK